MIIAIILSFILDYYISPSLIKRNRMSILVVIDAFVWSNVVLLPLEEIRPLYLFFYTSALFVYRIITQLTYAVFVPKGSTYKESKYDMLIVDMLNIVVLILIYKII